MPLLNWTPELFTEDGLEPLAPLPAVSGRVRTATAHAFAPAIGAAGGVLAATLILLTGPLIPALTLALGGTAAFVYFGTAILSGRRSTAALDIGTALLVVWGAVAAGWPAASVLLVHALWGILRGAWPGVAPGRRMVASWAAFHATAALLLGVGS